MVTVKYFGKLRTVIGIKEETLEVSRVLDLLKDIKKFHGSEAYTIAKRSHIIVNGESAGLHGGFRMKLDSGDIVQILPVCGGG